MNDLMRKSRYMSKLLRHDPEDLKIDSSGYVLVSDLLSKIDATIDDLNYIIDNNDKKRFSFNSDKTKIRASQGHSKGVDVNIDMRVADRIDILYHGTATPYRDWETDRKSTRLNSSHSAKSRMPSSA